MARLRLVDEVVHQRRASDGFAGSGGALEQRQFPLEHLLDGLFLAEVQLGQSGDVLQQVLLHHPRFHFFGVANAAQQVFGEAPRECLELGIAQHFQSIFEPIVGDRLPLEPQLVSLRNFLGHVRAGHFDEDFVERKGPHDDSLGPPKVSRLVGLAWFFPLGASFPLFGGAAFADAGELAANLLARLSLEGGALLLVNWD